MIEQLFEIVHLGVKALITPRQEAQRQLGANDWIGRVSHWSQPRASFDAMLSRQIPKQAPDFLGCRHDQIADLTGHLGA